jgi:hypothetical protein
MESHSYLAIGAAHHLAAIQTIHQGRITAPVKQNYGLTPRLHRFFQIFQAFGGNYAILGAKLLYVHKFQ